MSEPRAVVHPDFKHWIQSGASRIAVFERQSRKPVDPWAWRWYRFRKWIVKKLGGYMAVSPWNLGEPNPMFTDEDCEAMRAAVAEIGGRYDSCWNGAGTLCFSVRIFLPAVTSARLRELGKSVGAVIDLTGGGRSA